MVGSEVFSRILDFNDRTTCVLFGDGAGAVVLQPTEKEGQGILSTHLHSDGESAEILAMYNPGTHANYWGTKNYADFDGFVVLHGSDTMSYSASALSFMFENLNKPIVFTGSQLPIGDLRTDAKENFITALEIASAKLPDGKARVPEVCIYFENKLFRANRTFKYNSAKFEAFRSPNYPVLVEAGVHIKYNDAVIGKLENSILRVHTNVNNNIGVLKLYPGISPQIIDAVLESDAEAIIMETFGTGNTTTAKWFLDKLEAAIKKGKIILDISQCKAGTVEMGRYATSSELKNMGVINGYDMTFEAAVTKLMYLLGRNYPKDRLLRRLGTSIRGELTKN